MVRELADHGGLWKDIWLHEGFACYAEWIWSEEAGVMTVARRAATAWRKLAAGKQDLLVGDPGPELMFDDRVYKRGALALHALRLRCGDLAFFSLLHEWAGQNRHGSVHTPSSSSPRTTRPAWTPRPCCTRGCTRRPCRRCRRQRRPRSDQGREPG